MSDRAGAWGGADTGSLTRLVAEATEILRAFRREVPALDEAFIVAIGWATVDAGRAEQELRGVLDEPGRWEAAPRDDLLGATARLWRVANRRQPLLLVLEPDTEGRLAATLARHGEGIGAIYVAAGAESEFTDGSLSQSASGPLGPARRLAGGALGDASIIVLVEDSGR